MLIEASYDYPKWIDYTADHTHTLAEDDVIVFRVGVPGPADGEIPAPLVEHVLTRSTAKRATGTVPAASLQFTPGDYSYHVWVQRLGIVARGVFRLGTSLGRGPSYT